jgi:pimeloyl-ACP methyl ester carboxylesterase
MGSKDRDFKAPETEAQWVAQSLQASYTMVQDAGHYPHAEMPEVVTPRVLSFLQSLRWANENLHDA